MTQNNTKLVLGLIFIIIGLIILGYTIPIVSRISDLYRGETMSGLAMVNYFYYILEILGLILFLSGFFFILLYLSKIQPDTRQPDTRKEGLPVESRLEKCPDCGYHILMIGNVQKCTACGYSAKLEVSSLEGIKASISSDGK